MQAYLYFCAVKWLLLTVAMVRLAQVVLENLRVQAVVHQLLHILVQLAGLVDLVGNLQDKVVALLKALVVGSQLVTLTTYAYQECDYC
ncbi:MAG: hypothetical protein IJC97_04345 [Oscillospiraceae bacterium]|nr:hypothetical protein [Oscillospiraceae bacterium]